MGGVARAGVQFRVMTKMHAPLINVLLTRVVSTLLQSRDHVTMKTPARLVTPAATESAWRQRFLLQRWKPLHGRWMQWVDGCIYTPTPLPVMTEMTELGFLCGWKLQFGSIDATMGVHHRHVRR